jgi:hypothetical protein
MGTNQGFLGVDYNIIYSSYMVKPLPHKPNPPPNSPIQKKSRTTGELSHFSSASRLQHPLLFLVTPAGMIKHIEERKHVFGFDRNSDSVKTRG